MTELKFRVWDKVLKRYVHDGFIIQYNDDCSQSISISAYDDDRVIELFTGLHDKNGKEIYEGDIIESPQYVFSDYGFNTEDGLQHFFKKEEVKYSHGRFNVDDIMVKLWDLEVIGNIHEVKHENG